MDDLRFDRFVQSLAAPGTRRRFFAGLAAGALGLAGLNHTEARICSAPGAVCREGATCCSGKCGSKDRTGRRRCACTKSLDCPVPDSCHVATCTAGACGTEATVDFGTDLAHCGRCGRICPAPANGAAVCDAGQCDITCSDGYEEVEGACKLPFGATCTSGSECASGTCVHAGQSGVCAIPYSASTCGPAGGGSAQVFSQGGGFTFVCGQQTSSGCEPGPCPTGQVCGVNPDCFVLIDPGA